MTDIKPKFWQQLSTAFVVSWAIFLPILITYLFTSPLTRVTELWLRNVAALFAWSSAIILFFIFAAAFPIERYLVKPNHSAIRASTNYIWVFLGIFILAFVTIFLRIGLREPTDHLYWVPVYFIVGAPIGLVVAVISRLLYPKALKFQKTTSITAITLLALTIVGFIATGF